MNKILVFSHGEFDKFCMENNYNDDNVDKQNNIAFISIIGSDNCLKYYLHEDAKHWFQQNHNNVLNLEFDDIEEDIYFDGYLLSSFAIKDAQKSINFIENNLGKTFIIHCRAGKSRSQAFFRFITDYYSQYYSKNCGRIENPCLTPNIKVLSSLKEAYEKKHFEK